MSNLCTKTVHNPCAKKWVTVQTPNNPKIKLHKNTLPETPNSSIIDLTVTSTHNSTQTSTTKTPYLNPNQCINPPTRTQISSICLPTTPTRHDNLTPCANPRRIFGTSIDTNAKPVTFGPNEPKNWNQAMQEKIRQEKNKTK